ncbi:sigma-E factor negative regulatory protein [Massilia sp. DWR3-1-1]|uniref:sigma-E factor negative regulatory protein n=1 Tax=Massilia sp. DWR3-1-1 TaxID=2804559 RepID=UPI003CF3DDF4
MDAHKKIREHISALGDGELASSDLELATAALLSPDGEVAWTAYHRIGDVLRGEAAPEFSPGFNARLAARLAVEPLPMRRAGGAAVPAPAPLAAAATPPAVAPSAADGAVKALTTP